MDRLNSNAALAEWKHAVSIVGWNNNYNEYLHELAKELWPVLRNTRQGLLFVLSEHCPVEYRNECLNTLLPKRQTWLSNEEWRIFLEAIAISSSLDAISADIIYTKAPKKYRAFLAENSATPTNIRDRLLDSGKNDLLQRLSKNPSLSLEEINALSQAGHADIVRNLLQNFRHNQEVLSTIRSKIPIEINRHPDIIGFLEGALCTEDEFRSRIDHWLLETDINSILGALCNPRVHSKVSTHISPTSFANYYQLLIAGAENMSMGEEASFLLTHQVQEEPLKIAAANHPRTSLESLIKLAVDESSIVRSAAVKNMPVLSNPSIFYQIIFDEESEEVMAELLTRKEVSLKEKAKITSRVSDPWLLREIVKKAEQLPEEFFHYSLAVESSLLGYLVQHDNCPEVLIGYARQSSVEIERIAANYRS